MYVDPMNTEGFGERALEREIWRVVDSMNDEGFEEIWRERFYVCGSYEQ